jgi:hypothetical protein
MIMHGRNLRLHKTSFPQNPNIIFAALRGKAEGGRGAHGDLHIGVDGFYVGGRGGGF